MQREPSNIHQKNGKNKINDLKRIIKKLIKINQKKKK